MNVIVMIGLKKKTASIEHRTQDISFLKSLKFKLKKLLEKNNLQIWDSNPTTEILKII